MNKIVFLKQKNMLQVLYALAPLALLAIYYFGWRVAGVLVVALLFCLLTEWIMASKRNGKVSYAVFVTAALYGLSLPPTVPFWIVAVGAVIAILFGKEVFGGFGKNVFNPAIVGRGFVYVSFPIAMTSRFVPVFSGFPGGFAHWSYATMARPGAAVEQAGLSMADAITAATPMWSRRDYGYLSDWLNLLIGNIGAVFESQGVTRVLAAGSMGEVSALLILCSALYLLWTKTAQWRLMLSTLLGAVSLNALLLYGFGLADVPPIHFTLLSGALAYAAVFMVTDPVSAPKQKSAQWMYGLFIGAMIVLFRYRSVFAGGVAFAILLGNSLAPSLDLWLKRIQSAKKKAQAA